MLANGFLTPCGTQLYWFRVNWQGSQIGRFRASEFWQILQIAPNSLERLLNPYNFMFNSFRDCLCRYRVHSQEFDIDRFWRKSLGYSPCFWTWPILVSSGNLQIHWNASYMLANGFPTPCGTICVNFGWIRKGPKLAVLDQKAWAIAHGFEQGRYWKVLEIAPNSLKRTLHACKWISNSLRDSVYRFRVNWQGSQIGRFWAKSLGYSPCFWTWRIFASVRNHSKLS